MTRVAFVEHRTGLVMYFGKWYIVSDSGSSYCGQGFDSPKAAQAWWIATGLTCRPIRRNK